METPPPPPPPPPPAAPGFPPPPPRRKGWFGRNWFWFLPAGCLTFIVFFGAIAAVIVFAVFGALKSTEPYKTALHRAQTDPRVVAALGEPIRDGWMITGSTNVEGSGGKADLSVPLSGPKNKGTLHAVAAKSGGEWKFRKLTVEVNGSGERIDLGSAGQTSGSLKDAADGDHKDDDE